MRRFTLSGLTGALVLSAAVMWAGSPARAAITVTSLGPMVQINTAGLPGTHIRDFSTLWQASDPLQGTIFFAQSATSPLSIFRATTTDGGLNWTAGADTNLDNPGSASADERNPVIRDFNQDGNLIGLFGTKQGVYGSGFGPNDVLFRAESSDSGVSWSGESLVTFNAGAFAGHTGLNGFVEVFKTTGGALRGYTAMNNTAGTPPSVTHIVESTDDGQTWTDLGNVQIPGPGGTYNIVSANGPVFRFIDVDTSLEKLGWFCFGEGSGNRGVNFLVSSDEGLSWSAGGFTFLDSTIRAGDALFLSDSEVRLFYYRNTGSTPSDRQLWYEDFDLTGLSDVRPNNLTIPEPASLVLLVCAAVGFLLLRRRR